MLRGLMRYERRIHGTADDPGALAGAMMLWETAANSDRTLNERAATAATDDREGHDVGSVHVPKANRASPR